MSKLIQEAWLPLPGYAGAYSVSSLGRVRSERTKTNTATGIKHHNAKLTPDIAKQIRAESTREYGEAPKLARKHNVSITTIVAVLSNKTWKTA